MAEDPASWPNVFAVDGLTVSLREPEATDDPDVAVEALEIVPGIGERTRFFRLRIVEP